MIVIDYPRYTVSTHGIVFDTKRGKIVPSHPNRKGGYLAVKLYNNEGIRKTCYVHRLVSMAYLPNPDNLPEVSHIDFDTTNNDVSNLEWYLRKVTQNTLMKLVSLWVLQVYPLVINSFYLYYKVITMNSLLSYHDWLDVYEDVIPEDINLEEAYASYVASYEENMSDYYYY